MFRVRWAQKAIDEITVAWTKADSATRKAITAASNQIDKQLQTDPLAESESRPGGRHILFARPLGVIFRLEGDGVTFPFCTPGCSEPSARAKPTKP
jgi:hypothetical protein